MNRYIGLDAHASSRTLGGMTPSGKRIGSHVAETNERCPIEAVRRIPQPRHICLEEGTLSEWLYEVLSPCAEEGDGKREQGLEGRPSGCLRLGGRPGKVTGMESCTGDGGGSRLTEEASGTGIDADGAVDRKPAGPLRGGPSSSSTTC